MSISTKENIIAIAERHIQKYGYNAFSYHDIASELGIKNAAVHYHFPRKESLLVEVVRQALESFEDLKKAAEIDDNFLQRLFRFLSIYDHNLDRHNRVCLIGALATDFYTLQAPVHVQLKSLVQTIKSWLSDVMEKGRESGEFVFQGNSDDRAALICSSMAGALQLARILGDKEYHAIKSQLINDIKI